MFDEHVIEAARATQEFLKTDCGMDVSLEKAAEIFREGGQFWGEARNIDLTKLTIDELNALDYDLRRDWEHYDYEWEFSPEQAEDSMAWIDAQCDRIAAEFIAREELQRIDRIAEQALYEMSNH